MGSSRRSRGSTSTLSGDDTGTALSYFAPFRRGQRTMPGLQDAPEGQYLTDRLAIEAEKFIDNHKARPFFLYLPHYAPHIPLIAKPDKIAKYPRWDGTPHGRQENPYYAAMLESLDDAVGKVLEALDRNSLTDKTVVIFTSDNGGPRDQGRGSTRRRRSTRLYAKAKAGSTKAACAFP